MAVFTAKSADTIATEALNRSGISTPSSDQIDRVKNVFLRTILHDITASPGPTYNIRLKSLQAKDVQITTEGLFKYSVPSPISLTSRPVFPSLRYFIMPP